MGCEATKRGDVRDAGELSKLMVAPKYSTQYLFMY